MNSLLFLLNCLIVSGWPLYQSSSLIRIHPLPCSKQLDLLTRRRWGTAFLSLTTVVTGPARAAIDVSGLRVEGSDSDNSLRDQLRNLDGSASMRVQEIKATRQQEQQQQKMLAPSSQSIAVETIGQEATYAYRYTPGFKPTLQRVGLGERYKCIDQLVPPSGKGYLRVQFEFPFDWLQLDKMMGGIQYVDQRNGDKFYILKARLPTGATLVTVPKTFFGESIFDPKGTIIKSGVEVDEYRVTKSTVLSDGSSSTPRRRLLLKYYSVTGNGLRTERRGLVDAYEIDGVAYMMFTGSNAVKFEANGPERETVQRIVDSFQVEKVL